LQILVNAAFIAYNKGAFSMREASIISQSIDFFVETKQAVVPQFMPQQVPQTQTQQSTENLPTIPEETPQKVTFVSQ
jgi:polyhydroxyalkanoate synthesis regulator protein